MRKGLLTIVGLLLANLSYAQLPRLNYLCSNQIAVHADEGGPMYINGNTAQLTRMDDLYFIAKSAGIEVSVKVGENRAVNVFYRDQRGVNGQCRPERPSAHRHHIHKAEITCLKDVAKTTGILSSKLVVRDIDAEQNGIAIVIAVPGSPAPWACMSDNQGHLQGIAYTG